MSPLYLRLRVFLRVLPLGAFALVLVHQMAEHTLLRSLPWGFHFLSQLLFYGALGPLIAWATLRWILHRVRERDEAEARLRALYQASREVTLAADPAALVEKALHLPTLIIPLMGAVVLVREGPGGPWLVAGARLPDPSAVARLQEWAAAGEVGQECEGCRLRSAEPRQACSLLRAVRERLGLRVGWVVCVPLSREQPPSALLSLLLEEGGSLAPGQRQALEALVSGLAVALDRARLQARQVQMLQRLQREVRQEEGLPNALQRILEEIALAQRADAGVLFLEGEEGLTAAAVWPRGTSPSPFLAAAQAALKDGTEEPLLLHPEERQVLLAVPLVAEKEREGVLVLAGRSRRLRPPEPYLGVAVGTIALLVRSHRLHSRLEAQSAWEERVRLAREIHDGLAQSLGFLGLKAQEAERHLAHGDLAAARTALRELRQGAQDLYGDLRLAIQDLSWPMREWDLVEDLRRYVQTFGARTGLEVRFQVEGTPVLPPQAQVHLLRVVQEALANVYRHAGARRVWVRLRREGDRVCLEVEDDGKGLPLPARDRPGHFGLSFIRERVSALGGTVEVLSAPGRGTRLTVTVPQKAPAGWLS